MKVFISYSHKDQARVRNRIACLREDPRFQVFIDNESIPAGSTWLKVLAEEVAGSSALVLFVSKASAESPHVLNETSLAFRKSKVVPVFLDDLDDEVMATNPLMLILRNIQRIEAYRLDVPTCCSKIREALTTSRPSGEPCPIISVMGVAGGVGKTTFVMALSELIASTRHNVLLIDADCVADGLTSYLTGRAQRARSVCPVLDQLHDAKSGRELPVNAPIDTWDVTPNYLNRGDFGRIQLVPARAPGDNRRAPDLDPRAALEIMRSLVGAAGRMAGRSIDCVIVDCGADNSHLVSAAFVVCDYGFLVCRGQAAHIPKIERCKQYHRESYPAENVQPMNVVVNMAASDTHLKWSGIPGVSFLPDDPALRRMSGGDFDFEGVGLNAYYLEAARILNRTLGGEHRHLVPDEAKIWIKPYVEAMKDFPEKILNRPTYRYFAWLTALVSLLLVLVTAVSGLTLYRYRNAANEIVTTRQLSHAGRAPDKSEVPGVPAGLTGKVGIEQGEIRIKGMLSGEEIHLLKQASENEDWRDAVVSGAALAAEHVGDFEKRASQIKSVALVVLALGPGGLLLWLYRQRTVGQRKSLLRELIDCRESGDEGTIVGKINQILEEGPSARTRLSWFRNELRNRRGALA